MLTHYTLIFSQKMIRSGWIARNCGWKWNKTVIWVSRRRQMETGHLSCTTWQIVWFGALSTFEIHREMGWRRWKIERHIFLAFLIQNWVHRKIQVFGRRERKWNVSCILWDSRFKIRNHIFSWKNCTKKNGAACTLFCFTSVIPKILKTGWTSVTSTSYQLSNWQTIDREEAAKKGFFFFFLRYLL